MISAKKNNFIVEYRPSTIRAARISSETTPTVVEEVLELDLRRVSDPASEVRSFAKAKSNAFMQASCVVYPRDRLVRQLTMDAQKGKEVEFVMDFLKNSAGVEPEEFSVYCLSTEDGSDLEIGAAGKKNMLVCGVSSDGVSEVQKELVDRAIYPRRLELGTVGIIGALKDVLENKSGRSTALFLEIDEKSTEAVIVGPKGVEMARRIDCGSSDIAAVLKAEMNLKDDMAAERILQSPDFDLGSIAPKLLRKLLRELQSSIGFFEVQTGNSVSDLYCLKDGRSLPWLEASVCDLLNLSPLRLDVKDWLREKGVTFGGDDLAGKFDETWISLLSLVLDFGKGGADS